MCFNFLSRVILFMLIVIASATNAISSKKDKPSYLKLIVKIENSVISTTKSDPRNDSIKNISKKLNTLAKEMEQTAKLYNTINQKAYWEIEGKNSLTKLVKSEGYYETIIETELLDNENTIIFYISDLTRYTIKNIDIISQDKDLDLPDFEKLKIKEGEFAIAGNILSAERRLAKHIERQNCLLTLNVDHEAFINELDNTISVVYIVKPGVYAKVKSVELLGLKSISQEYARKIVPIKDGQCFKPSLITEAQNTLQKTGLFSTINIKVQDKTDENDETPVIFDVKERKHKSLKAGISYGSDLGLGATLGWDHRNLFGNGETFSSELFANQKDQKLDLEFTKPFYRQDNQTLKIGLYGENISSKAFKSKEGAVSAGLERKLTNVWSASASAKYSYSVVKAEYKNRIFPFLSFPLLIKRDTRDSILNSRLGNELILKFEPFYTLKPNNKSFTKTEFIGNFYTPLAPESKPEPLIAFKLSSGSITCATLQNIPLNERFYLGGPGSLRGYGYQLAQNIQKGKRPVGGLSFIGTSVEFRIKAKSNFGFVTFIDSGNLYTKSTPDFKERWLHGVGFGIRYFTDFGPLRADIAFPLQARKIIDRPFQIYFGIGQSF